MAGGVLTSGRAWLGESIPGRRDGAEAAVREEPVAWELRGAEFKKALSEIKRCLSVCTDTVRTVQNVDFLAHISQNFVCFSILNPKQVIHA